MNSETDLFVLGRRPW